ncbi:MAG TPA: ROK family transcriptional regulator [Thermotogaceae bacterium]|nr:ROK family transcriptional regulator [Thermotogaceae bacterium]
MVGSFTPESSKHKNLLKVLEILMSEELSRADIADITGLTRTAVGNIIKRFINIGFVEEKDSKGSGVGRKRILLDIVPSFMHVIGLGISRNRIEGCLTDTKGKLICNRTVQLKRSEDVVRKIYDTINSLLNEAHKNSIEVKAIGVGVPGPLDIKRGIVIKPPKFPGFENVKLVELLEKKYGIDVWIENDADMAAWGEKCYGEGRNLSDFIYIRTCEGIGAGIIIDNQLYHGKLGYSGEIGHLLVKNGEKFEYFENLYGKDKIIEKAREKFSIEEGLNYIEDRVRKGDKEAIEFVKEISENLGALIISIVHVTGISDVFIGGDYQVFGDFLLNEVRDMIKRYEFSHQQVNVRFSQLGDLAMPLGAVAYAIGMYLKKLVLES